MVESRRWMERFRGEVNARFSGGGRCDKLGTGKPLVSFEVEGQYPPRCRLPFTHGFGRVIADGLRDNAAPERESGRVPLAHPDDPFPGTFSPEQRRGSAT